MSWRRVSFRHHLLSVPFKMHHDTRFGPLVKLFFVAKIKIFCCSSFKFGRWFFIFLYFANFKTSVAESANTIKIRFIYFKKLAKPFFRFTRVMPSRRSLLLSTKLCLHWWYLAQYCGHYRALFTYLAQLKWSYLCCNAQGGQGKYNSDCCVSLLPALSP